MVSHWNLSDSKSPQVSVTLLNILANLNNAVVWMVSVCPLIFMSSSPFTNLLGIVPSVPITIGIIVTLMFHSFFSSLARSRYLSLYFLLILIFGLLWQQSPLFSRFFFWLTITRSSHLAEIRWSVCISKSQRNLCISYSRTDSRLCICYLFIWSNLNFLHNSQ